MLALRAVPVLIGLGLLIYCVIDVAQTPAVEVCGLSKGWWIVTILCFPIVGGIVWLVAGRPERLRLANDRAMGTGFPEYPILPPGPIGPDDDPEFLARLEQLAGQSGRRRDPPVDVEPRPESTSTPDPTKPAPEPPTNPQEQALRRPEAEQRGTTAED